MFGSLKCLQQSEKTLNSALFRKHAFSVFIHPAFTSNFLLGRDFVHNSGDQLIFTPLLYRPINENRLQRDVKNGNIPVYEQIQRNSNAEEKFCSAYGVSLFEFVVIFAHFGKRAQINDIEGADRRACTSFGVLGFSRYSRMDIL